jgi:PAS domain S-box-containing protein
MTTSPAHPLINRSLAETMLMFGLAILAAGIVFLDWGHAMASPSLHSWLDHATKGHGLFLFLVWSASRFTSRATAWQVLLVASASITGTQLGTGPFVGTPGLLLFYLLSYALVALALSSYTTANRKLTAALQSQQDDIAYRLENYIHALDEHAIVSTTNVQSEIIAANDKFCQISGYSREELIGKNHRIVNSGLHSTEFFQAMYRDLAAGKSWHGEIRNRAKDGRYYWVQTTVVPFLDTRGNPVKYISIRTDITAQKQIEIELAQAAEALTDAYRKLDTDHRELRELKAEADRMHRQLLQTEKMSAIGHLAAGVAHEINNPIGFVNSNLGTLGKYIDDLMRFVDLGAATPAGQTLQSELDLEFIRADLPDLLAESFAGMERVRKIVLALKEFSHVGEVEWQHADLLIGLENTLRVAWNEIKQKAEIIRELAPLPRVLCVPTQINQIFLSLLMNAAQAIATSGVITLRSGVAGDQAWIEIADTGTGMDEATQRQMFNPFFTTKPVGVGTGLGLTISWDIVQKHQGAIEVTSEPGQGSCFRLSLPIAGPSNRESAP